MVKLKRGGLRSKPEKVIEEKMPESSEDEGPEEVAFEDSKAVALKIAKDARDLAEREKALLKEKRRKRQLFFQEQKKNRLLPETVLEELETGVQKEQKSAEEKDDEEEEAVEVKKSKKVCKSLQGNCSVMRVKDASSDTSVQKSAMDFIQGRLYGQGCQRTTNAELLSLEKKRGLNQGAAVQFVNKKWGTEQKAKAVKSNKRFIHKRKLIAS